MITASTSPGCNIPFQWMVGENLLSHGCSSIKPSLFIGMLYFTDPRAAFLYLDTIDILGGLILCCGVWLVLCRMFGSFSGLSAHYMPAAPLPNCDNQTCL